MVIRSGEIYFQTRYTLMNKTLKHVFFDLDHTLWDFDRNSALAFERVFRLHEIDIPLPQFLEVYEPINFAYWKKYREERVTKQELRRGRLVDAFQAFDVTFPINIIDNLAEAYIHELPGDNHLLPGAKEILEYLSEKYTLHIITNGFTEVQNIKLSNSDIAHYFMSVTASEEVGVKKPNSKVFRRALEKAKTTPEESIMIGDTFEADILGAQAVGMDTLFYNYRDEVISEGFLKVDALLDIKNHL